MEVGLEFLDTRMLLADLSFAALVLLFECGEAPLTGGFPHLPVRLGLCVGCPRLLPACPEAPLLVGEQPLVPSQRRRRERIWVGSWLRLGELAGCEAGERGLHRLEAEQIATTRRDGKQPVQVCKLFTERVGAPLGLLRLLVGDLLLAGELALLLLPLSPPARLLALEFVRRHHRPPSLHAAQPRHQGKVDFPPLAGHRGYAARVDGSEWL
jgi:hypothetical protein